MHGRAVGSRGTQTRTLNRDAGRGKSRVGQLELNWGGRGKTESVSRDARDLR